MFQLEVIVLYLIVLCWGNDGIVRIINNACNKKIDSAGKIIIHDNSLSKTIRLRVEYFYGR